jgi:hypothetical protein
MSNKEFTLVVGTAEYYVFVDRSNTVAYTQDARVALVIQNRLESNLITIGDIGSDTNFKIRTLVEQACADIVKISNVFFDARDRSFLNEDGVVVASEYSEPV